MRSRIQVVKALSHPLRLLWRAARKVVFHARNLMARPHPNPVFVLGNQKSGTSAIAALLGMMTGSSTAVDLRREIGKQTYPRIVRGELPFEALVSRNRLDFSRQIVKEPNLTLFYDALKQRYPLSRFVFVVRDPRDNLRSILNRLPIPGDLPALEAHHMSNVDPGFELVLDGRWAGIAGGEHYIDRLCARWNACCDVYLTHSDEICLVRYEDFMAGKVACLENLARRVALDPIHDVRADLDRQFQRGGHSGVQLSEFFGPNLARIESACAERMRLLGYGSKAEEQSP
jgi:hypothetical protein